MGVIGGIGNGQGALEFCLSEVADLAQLLGAIVGGAADARTRPGGAAVVLIEAPRVGQGVELDVGQGVPQGRLAGILEVRGPEGDGVGGAPGVADAGAGVGGAGNRDFHDAAEGAPPGAVARVGKGDGAAEGGGGKADVAHQVAVAGVVVSGGAADHIPRAGGAVVVVVERAILGGGQVKADVAQRVPSGAAAGIVEVRSVEPDEAVDGGGVGDGLAAAASHRDGDGAVETDVVLVIPGEGDGDGASVARGGDKGDVGKGGGAAPVVVGASGDPGTGGAVVVIVEGTRAGRGEAGKAEVIQDVPGDAAAGVVELPGAEGDGLVFRGVVVHRSRAVVHMEDEVAGEGGTASGGAREGDGDGAAVARGGHEGDVGNPGRAAAVVVPPGGDLRAGAVAVIQVQGSGAGGGQAVEADVVQGAVGGLLAGVVEIGGVQELPLVPPGGVLHVSAALSVGSVDPDPDGAAVGGAGAVGAAVGDIHVSCVTLGRDKGDVVQGGVAGGVVTGGVVHLGGVLAAGAVVEVEGAPAGGGQAEGDVADGPASAALADGGEVLRREGDGLVHRRGVADVPGGRGLDADGAGEGGADGGDGVVVHHGGAVKARQGDEGYVPQGHLALAGGLVIIPLRAAHAMARGLGGGVLVVEHAVFGGDLQAVDAVQGASGLGLGAAVQLAQDAGEGIGGLGAHVDGDGLGDVLGNGDFEAGAVAGSSYGSFDDGVRAGIIGGDPSADHLGDGVVAAFPVDGFGFRVAVGVGDDADVPVLEDIHHTVFPELDGFPLAAGGGFLHIAQQEAGDLDFPDGGGTVRPAGLGADDSGTGGDAFDGAVLGDCSHGGVAGAPGDRFVLLKGIGGGDGGIELEGFSGIQEFELVGHGIGDGYACDLGSPGLHNGDDAKGGGPGVRSGIGGDGDGLPRRGVFTGGDFAVGGYGHNGVFFRFPGDVLVGGPLYLRVQGGAFAGGKTEGSPVQRQADVGAGRGHGSGRGNREGAGAGL